MRKEWGRPIVQRSSRSLKRPSEMDFYRSDLVGEELGIEHLDADGEGIAGSRLLPTTVDGLLAAGKSAVKRGPQIRQRYCVQLMGQAAGVAATLAVSHGVEPRQINVRELQKILHTLGSEIGPDKRLKELGII